MTTLANKIEALRTENSALQAENDRLNALIDATARHWMDLQFKHPIQWEGAIDGAMKAACDTILRALRERDQAVEALKTADAWLDRWARHIGDCPGIDGCECGLTRARYEAETTIASIEGAGHE